MGDTFAMKFPVYSLLLKDASDVVLLRGGREPWLPLFTGTDSLVAYLGRPDIGNVAVVEFTSPGELVAFLKNPPSRTGRAACRTCVIDPVGDQVSGVTLMPFDRIIAHLSR
jgi:hypothetical protein